MSHFATSNLDKNKSRKINHVLDKQVVEILQIGLCYIFDVAKCDIKLVANCDRFNKI